MKIKRFSTNQILRTNAPGFQKGKRYDQDLNRLGRWSTQKEMGRYGDLNKEIRQMHKELNEGRLGLWQHTD